METIKTQRIRFVEVAEDIEMILWRMKLLVKAEKP